MLYRSLNKYHYIADIDTAVSRYHALGMIDKPVSLRTSVIAQLWFRATPVTITVALVAMVITVLVGLFHA